MGREPRIEDSVIMPPFHINSQAPILLEFRMDGSDVNIRWWETDVPLVMTWVRSCGVSENEQKRGWKRKHPSSEVEIEWESRKEKISGKLTFAFHMPSVCDNPQSISFISRNRHHLRLYRSRQHDAQCMCGGWWRECHVRCLTRRWHPSCAIHRRRESVHVGIWQRRWLWRDGYVRCQIGCIWRRVPHSRLGE